MDKEKIEQAVSMIIEAIGEDPNREGLLETPQRVARMYEEIFSGLIQCANITYYHFGEKLILLIFLIKELLVYQIS